MCGIFGFAGEVTPAKSRVVLMRALCIRNADRGNQSAGIATVGMDLRCTILKDAVEPRSIAKSANFTKLLSRDVRAAIGHCRLATHGAITKENAHPFRIGKTIGVHNGVVSNVTGLERYCKDKGFPADYQVDSQYLIHILDRTGTLGPASGSLNVAYFGPKDSADLRIIRHHNPLFIAVTRGERAVVFSSEEKHLRDSMSIAGLRAEYYELEDDWALSAYFDDKTRKVTIDYTEAPFAKKDEYEQYNAFSDKRSYYRGGAYDDEYGIGYATHHGPSMWSLKLQRYVYPTNFNHITKKWEYPKDAGDDLIDWNPNGYCGAQQSTSASAPATASPEPAKAEPVIVGSSPRDYSAYANKYGVAPERLRELLGNDDLDSDKLTPEERNAIVEWIATTSSDELQAARADLDDLVHGDAGCD